MSNNTQLKSFLLNRVESLSPQLQKAAFFVVENQVDVATRSQRFIAQSSGLPAPTFTRLARAMGMQSYDEMRDICRQDIADSKQTLSDRASHLNMSSDDVIPHAPLVEQHISAGVQNIRSLVAHIDIKLLEQASIMLAEARRVYLVGELSSRALVEYASYIANLSLTGWKTLGRSTESLSAELQELSASDVALVVSMGPYSSRAITIAQHIANRDIPIIAITDHAMAPIIPIAKHSFLVGAKGPHFFPSNISTLLLIETLLDMTTRKRGADAQNKIAAIERQNYNLGEYWQDGPDNSKRRRQK